MIMPGCETMIDYEPPDQLRCLPGSSSSRADPPKDRSSASNDTNVGEWGCSIRITCEEEMKGESNLS